VGATQSGGFGGGGQVLQMKSGETTVHVQLFVDGYVVEAYWQGGRVAMTSEADHHLADAHLVGSVGAIVVTSSNGTSTPSMSSTSVSLQSMTAWSTDSIWTTPDDVLHAALGSTHERPPMLVYQSTTNTLKSEEALRSAPRPWFQRLVVPAAGGVYGGTASSTSFAAVYAPGMCRGGPRKQNKNNNKHGYLRTRGDESSATASCWLSVRAYRPQKPKWGWCSWVCVGVCVEGGGGGNTERGRRAFLR
jgi:hypothetical protein